MLRGGGPALARVAPRTEQRPLRGKVAGWPRVPTHPGFLFSLGSGHIQQATHGCFCLTRARDAVFHRPSPLSLAALLSLPVCPSSEQCWEHVRIGPVSLLFTTLQGPRVLRVKVKLLRHNFPSPPPSLLDPNRARVSGSSRLGRLCTFSPGVLGLSPAPALVTPCHPGALHCPEGWCLGCRTDRSPPPDCRARDGRRGARGTRSHLGAAPATGSRAERDSPGGAGSARPGGPDPGRAATPQAPDPPLHSGRLLRLLGGADHTVPRL